MRYKRSFKKKKKKQRGGPTDPPSPWFSVDRNPNAGMFGELGNLFSRRSPDDTYYGDDVTAPANAWARQNLGPYVGNAVEGVNELVRTPLNIADAIGRAATFEAPTPTPQDVSEPGGETVFFNPPLGSAPTGEGTVLRRPPLTPNVPATRPQDTIFPADFNFGSFSADGSPISGQSQSSPSSPPPPSFGEGVGQANIGNNQLSSPSTGANIAGMTAETPEGSEGQPLGDIASGEEGGNGFDFSATDFLQFAPDMLNIATGLLGRDQTPDPTTVSNRAVNMMPSRVNVNPQLQAAAESYRAILADPNASATQKLAAQAQLNSQRSRIYADKQNREAQMQANKAQVQGQIDRQNAQYANQARQEQMQSDANLGPTGNFVRQGLTSASQKLLQKKSMENKRQQANKELMTVISSYPKAVQKRILENLDLNG